MSHFFTKRCQVFPSSTKYLPNSNFKVVALFYKKMSSFSLLDQINVHLPNSDFNVVALFYWEMSSYDLLDHINVHLPLWILFFVLIHRLVSTQLRLKEIRRNFKIVALFYRKISSFSLLDQINCYFKIVSLFTERFQAFPIRFFFWQNMVQENIAVCFFDMVQESIAPGPNSTLI